MQKLNIRKQIGRLYVMTAVGYFQIAGASWVALLAQRGFSLFEIGVVESIFHIVSVCFEIPSGVVADVFGRRRTLVMSRVVSLAAGIWMIVSDGFWSVAVAMGFSALSYNLASGTMEALAYDSLKEAGQEGEYNRYASTEMVLYRITTSAAQICAGAALWLGYRKAYAVDCVILLFAIAAALGLKEAGTARSGGCEGTGGKITAVISESWSFLEKNRGVRRVILVNSGIGAVSTLLRFFLQAKLPQAGLNSALLGPALFVIGLGAALGARMASRFQNSTYRNVVIASLSGVVFAFATAFTGNPPLMFLGGFVGAFADDFLEVKTDVLINEKIPSEQRATLVSVSSFLFSVVMIAMSTLMGWMMG